MSTLTPCGTAFYVLAELGETDRGTTLPPIETPFFHMICARNTTLKR